MPDISQLRFTFVCVGSPSTSEELKTISKESFEIVCSLLHLETLFIFGQEYGGEYDGDEYRNSKRHAIVEDLAPLKLATKLKSFVMVNWPNSDAVQFLNGSTLEEIDISSRFISGDVGTKINRLSNLKKISLSTNRTNRSIFANFDFPALPRLVELQVVANEGFSDADMEPLTKATQLETVTLGGNIRGGALKFLVGLPKLTSLEVYGKLQDKPLEPLRHLTALKKLLLNSEFLTEAAHEHVAPLVKLEDLKIEMYKELKGDYKRSLTKLTKLEMFNGSKHE